MQLLFIIILLLGTGALTIHLTRRPVSRSKHVLWVLAVMLVTILVNYQNYDQDLPIQSESYFFALISTVAGIFAIYANARRFIDLGWNKWWTILSVIPVPNLVVSILPFFYATRNSGPLEPVESADPSEDSENGHSPSE